ncbi:MAG: HEAT repeat domain-containing protein [Euryarchaeota archaeon]|jgi:HEAT repeat protein|uniref:HEAT repeat domain-containing protein n=1 Tax=Methanobacterium sp. MZD130B TaxID=3394378 RepID=UPI0017797648|nr:HEAT repeat domain-containing protein [Euryarchaeota archaeon]HHT19364.1 HEAT repeat domain-containing protein [Methanobacterium sp.]
MNPKTVKRMNREKRGQISSEELNVYRGFATHELIEMLNNSNPQKRTISASILGEKQDVDAIIPLCTAFKREKALYSRMAISEALSQIGVPAISPLLDLLGEIGKNQETELPQKYFNKKSYPLVRDLAARTLVKIGKPATPYLIEVIENGTDYKAQQAIDAIGGIAAKTGDKRGLEALLNVMERNFDNKGNKITLWKTIRALSGFKNSQEAADSLLNIIRSDYDSPIIWEALRSLGNLNVTTPETINLIVSFTNNKNPEIRKSAQKALISLDNL